MTMSIKILWRSTVFILTLIFIYLAFPILIVPSSLPAIKTILVGQSSPIDQTEFKSTISSQTADAQINQIDLETVPTLQEKLEVIKKIHQQGVNLILARN